jgi:hypothetical protein
MHANPLLVNGHYSFRHLISHGASQLAIATRALATMPSSHPAASPRFHADSLVCRDCWHRRSRIFTPHGPEAGPAAAVSLSPCLLESQSGEPRKGRLGSPLWRDVTVSLSAA